MTKQDRTRNTIVNEFNKVRGNVATLLGYSVCNAAGINPAATFVNNRLQRGRWNVPLWPRRAVRHFSAYQHLEMEPFRGVGPGGGHHPDTVRRGAARGRCGQRGHSRSNLRISARRGPRPRKPCARRRADDGRLLWRLHVGRGTCKRDLWLRWCCRRLCRKGALGRENIGQ